MGLNKELRRILRESARGTFRESSGFPVTEVNHCHGKGRGHPCGPGEGKGEGDWTQSKFDNLIDELTGPAKAKGSQASDFYSADEIAVGTPSFVPKAVAAPAVVKKATHKMTYPAAGNISGPRASSPQHFGTYRGMEIHTLPSYTTPYYFVNAPGFGGMYHSPSLARIKKQVDTFKDTGLTAHRADRAKASARYQKRKAAKIAYSKFYR
jgi:hypothetical protein